MVKARVKYHARIGYTVECQRAKYKHWHLIGTHTETDIEFRRALGGRLGPVAPQGVRAGVYVLKD